MYRIAALLSATLLSQLVPAAHAADVWSIESGPIDPDRYFGEILSNGMIGLRTMPVPFRTERTLINGTYEAVAAGYTTALAHGFDFLNLELAIDGEPIQRFDQVSEFRQRLQMRTAAFTTSFEFDDKASVTYTLRVLRHLPYAAMLDVVVEAKQPLVISATSGPHTPQVSSTDPYEAVMPLKDIRRYARSGDVPNSGIE